MKVWKMLQQRKISVGVSDHNGQLTFVVLRLQKNNWQVVRYGQESTALATNIGSYAGVIAAVPYKNIICKTIKLDIRLKTNEIKRVVLEQIKHNLGELSPKLVIDFERLDVIPRKDLIDIRWIAAKCHDVENIIEKLAQLNLKVSAIDVDALALECMGYFLAKQAQLNAVTTAIIHIQDQSSLLCILKNNQSLLIHSAQHYTHLFSNLSGFAVEKIWLSGDVLENIKDIADDIQRISGVDTVLANPFLYFNLNGIADKKYLLENSHVYTLSCALAMRGSYKREY